MNLPADNNLFQQVTARKTQPRRGTTSPGYKQTSAETGFYYLRSRYYDPTVGRFLNADGLVTAGQGVSDYNMFAYCGNNPVNRADYSGQFWSEIWEFIKTAVSEIGRVIESMSYAYALCGSAALADGPLPIGDMIGLAGAVLLTVGAIAVGISQAAKVPTKAKAKAKSEEKDIAIPSDPQNQAYFPQNPYEFAPRGLIMHEYPGTKNGRIIEWRDPISKAKIFEWDEDIKSGSHYHVMEAQWGGQHRGAHYLPGTPVPEPWNSIYFGG